MIEVVSSPEARPLAWNCGAKGFVDDVDDVADEDVEVDDAIEVAMVEVLLSDIATLQRYLKGALSSTAVTHRLAGHRQVF
jgi:hypothetical protein